jgi:AcrR family transcriptional regulator
MKHKPETSKLNPTKNIDPTRQRIIDAAGMLFAKQGFAATSVREITRAAQCNLAAMNYHFGNKEKLYIEVFHLELIKLREQRIGGIQQTLQEEKGDNSLEGFLRGFATIFLAPLIQEETGPRLIQMMMREMLESHLPEGMFLNEVVIPVNRVLLDALTRVCPGLDEARAQLCIFSIIGQLIHIVRMHNVVGHAKVEKFLLPDIDNLVEHVVRFSTAGVRDNLVND